MKKFLSVIIPRYKESEKQIFPLLSSINCQVGIDFDDIDVIIVNDGKESKPLDENFLSLFNMKIHQINLEENKGPGVARQVGLDYSKAQYVMFCDADDVIHNVGVLGAFISESDKTAADIIKSSWLEEQVTQDGDCIYVTHEIENTWMHGKVFRRQFLVQNNITFHPTLRIHEDSYFLAIAATLASNQRFIPAITYVWKWGNNTITRRNNSSYTYNSFPTFIRACVIAFEEVEKRNVDVMEYNIVQFVMYNYFTLHRPDWIEEKHKEYVKQSENTFAECIKKYWSYYTNASKETINKIYTEERQKSFNGFIENELLDDWLKRIGLI